MHARREVLLLGAAAGLTGLSALAAGAAFAQTQGTQAAQPAAARPVLLISRRRLLAEPREAVVLAAAERAMTAQLQEQIDAVKADFSTEEQELARLRNVLDRAVFDERVATFDREVRAARADAQQRAAALQTAFREAREQFEARLRPILERVRLRYRASVMIDLEAALAADPAADVTDEVIAILDAESGPPEIPSVPGLSPPAPPGAGRSLTGAGDSPEQGNGGALPGGQGSGGN